MSTEPTRHDRIAATHVDQGPQRLIADEEYGPDSFWEAFDVAATTTDERGLRGPNDLSPAARAAVLDLHHRREPVVSSLVAEEVLDWCQELPDFWPEAGQVGVSAVRSIDAD